MEKVIKVLLGVYFLVFPLGQLTRLSLLDFGLPPEMHLYLPDLVLTLLLGLWLGWRFFFARKSYPWPSLAKPITLFAFVAAFSLVINAGRLVGDEVLMAGLYLARWVALAGLYFVVADLKWSGYKWLIWAGVAVAVGGLTQYLFWPDIRPLEILGWDPHYYRAAGTLLDPGFTGIVLVLTLILLAANHRQLFLYYLLFAVCYLALALTYSRSSYLAYFVGMAAVAWVRKAPRFFLIVVLLGMMTFLVLPRSSGGEGVNLQRQSTVAARLVNWQQAWQIITDNSFWGVGFNAYRYAQRDRGFLESDWQFTHAGAGADASLLFIWATTGVVGLGAYLWLWAKVFKTGSLPVRACLIALFVHALFLNSLFYPWVMGWLWVLVATESN